MGASAKPARLTVDPWQAANASRGKFEAQASHTKADYSRVMEEFRAIYHANPGDAHAAAAVGQVAELLAEQGRELHDDKALRDAAGQYEFLAKQYPASGLAAPALGAEVVLFGPDGLNDAAEAKRVAAELKKTYPRSAVALLAKKASADASVTARAKSQSGVPSSATQDDSENQAAAKTTVTASTKANTGTSSPRVSRSGRDDNGGVSSDGALPVVPLAVRNSTSANPDMGHPSEVVVAPVPKAVASAKTTARVTGIRHWSTASYTRVAIDLGDEVEYQAARVEHPDRIFFDLHHARLAPELIGKSFGVTDDGFLTRIRAAQYSDDVTRVVLDVHEVTEYSAFLLPNPYRLIIDIHGKQPEGQGVGNREQGVANNSVVAEVSKPEFPKVEAWPRPSVDAAVSSLPPMPVTDGSSGFGLPAKKTGDEAKNSVVAPPRVVIPVKPTESRPVPNTTVSRSADMGSEVAAVSDQPGKVEATRKPTSSPISAKSKQETGNRKPEALKAAPVMPAPPTADGQTSLLRALGLKIGRIVIDAGHGGHDSGTLGADGIQEKDVVLDVALRLGKLLHQRMGAEIVYTRADDTFIPLETRTAIANKAQADLFISVHANSSADPSARGVEVYYLNFTSDPEAMRVASRENAVSSQSVHELSDLVKKIALKDKIDESKELAGDVEESLYAGLEKGNDGLKDRGVKKAPFVVLIGANMPSILAEISFVTNPDDAEQLRTPEYRERVAESLFNGVARYAGGINGVKTPVVQRASVRGR